MNDQLIHCDNNYCKNYQEGNHCRLDFIALAQILGEDKSWVYCEMFEGETGEEEV